MNPSTKKYVIGNINDLLDGENKHLTVNDNLILLVRRNGSYHAFSGTCPHHHGEFKKGGLVCGDSVMCPWHHATFSLCDGSLENPPHLDNLAEFPVITDGNELLIELPDKPSSGAVPGMTTHRPHKDARTFIIAGAGAGGNAAAETLRAEGFEGRIIMISREMALPYDRTLLSKTYLADQSDLGRIPIRSEDFYRQYGIELLLGTQILEVNPAAQKIVTEDSTLKYDKLLLATGGVPRRLEISGANLKNIFTFRSLSDAKQIIEIAQKNTSAVIVGAGFIAMECAAALRKRNVKVTVIAPESIPFASLLGESIGKEIQTLHEKNGVTFRLNSGIEAFNGKHRLESVALKDGSEIAADFAIVGIGIKPATDFLPRKMLNADGSITVNTRLEVSFADHIYAAGDIASFPVARFGTDSLFRVEHWRVAEQHGRIAASNMTGNVKTVDLVPMFWTDQGDFNLNYTGYVGKWDEVIIDGNPSESFVACYLKDGKLLAAAGKWRDRDMCAIEQGFIKNRLPEAELLRAGNFNWTGWLAKLDE